MMSLTARPRICTAMIAALALFTPLAAQDRLAAGLARYEQETDPVRKARALVKFGEDQIDEARKQLKAGEDVASLHTLEQYRDEVRQTAAALKATGVDAEKKPAGFKELQISLRESVRRIDDLILALPVDKRPFFREVRTDLVKTQNELIDALFPRQPERNSRKANP
jgi:predicted  nucleic acid-binding Zn-ribbon protein